MRDEGEGRRTATDVRRQATKGGHSERAAASRGIAVLPVEGPVPGSRFPPSAASLIADRVRQSTFPVGRYRRPERSHESGHPQQPPASTRLPVGAIVWLYTCLVA